MSIKHDVSMIEYLCLDALSSGVAFEAITRSPLHAKHKNLNRTRQSKAADMGTVVHQILLEGHEENIVWLPFADYRKNECKTLRDEAYEAGKTPMLDSQQEDVQRIVHAVREQLVSTEIADVFGSGNAEVTVEWSDSGIDCKARPDYLTDDWYISVKTTGGSVEPVGFNRRMIGPMGHDFGVMFYERGLRENGWNGRSRILAIEQNAPFGIQIFELSQLTQQIKRAEVEKAITLWAECLATATFPGYGGGETYFAEPTPWQLSEAEDAGLLSLTTAFA